MSAGLSVCDTPGEVERTKTVKSVVGLAQLAVAIVGLALLPRADTLTLIFLRIMCGHLNLPVHSGKFTGFIEVKVITVQVSEWDVLHSFLSVFILL